jgi:hypothetical protein
MTIIMSDYPIKHSQTRQGRYSSQAQYSHAHFQSPGHQILSTNKSGDLDKRISYQGSLPRPPQKISGNLISLVSKFETLDALGVPIETSALKPAPLRLPQHSPGDKLKGRPSRAEGRSRFSCQKFRSPSRSKDLFSDEELVSSVQRPPFNLNNIPSKHDNRFEQFQFGKLSHFQGQSKPGNTRRLDVSPDKADLFTSTKVRIDHGSQPRKSTASRTRRTAILDRIKFFDGSMDSKISPCKPHLQICHFAQEDHPALRPVISPRERTSLEAYPKTPLSRGTSNYNSLPSNASRTRLPMSQAKKINVLDLLTPTKSTLYSNPTKRNLALRENLSEPLFAGTSPLKSSRQENSPRKSFSTSKVNASPQAVDNQSLRGLLTFHGANSPLQEKTEPQERDASQHSNRSRIPILKRTNPMNTERRIVSGKIEDLYRNKSREREHEDHLDVSQESGIFCNSSTKQTRGRYEPPNEISTVNEKFLRGRESKVSNRHTVFTVFDRPKVAKKLFLPEYLYHSRNPGAKTVTPRKRETFSGPTPLPVLLSPRLYEVSPKTILSPPSKDEKGRARSKVVEDRIKRFEEIPGPKKNQPTRLIFGSLSAATAANTTAATRRKKFEDSRRRFETTGRVGEGIHGEAIDNLSGELRDADDELQKRKRRSTTNETVLVPNPIKRPVRAKATAVGGASGDMIGAMTIRMANCGLKEPKPLRYSEMKKILLLCQGKAGGALGLYEERRSVSPSKQRL